MTKKCQQKLTTKYISFSQHIKFKAYLIILVKLEVPYLRLTVHVHVCLSYFSTLHSGDMVMADKGFLIHDLMPTGVGLNIPPFLCTPQFTEAEAAATRSIAKSRIHVERAIARVKNFKILDLMPHTLRQFASVIFQTCGSLVNVQPPLIREAFENKQ